MVAGLVLAYGGELLSSSPPPVPAFVEETASSGIDHVYAGDFQYYVGGGVAAFDCNDDGRPELAFAGGSGPAALYQNDSTIGGALRFHELTEPAFDLDAVTGAYPLDVDGDGLTDLVLLRVGGNVILRGLGGCQFERANEAWHFDGGDAWSTAFSATWEQGARWPTMAVGNYLDQASSNSSYLCSDNQLYRPATDGGFAGPVALTPSWCALSMLFSSWDRSGRADLRVSNDRHYYGELSDGQEQLWRVAPAETPRLYTEADGWQPVRIWGMGIASDDLTDDGYPEYYLTSQGDNKLQTLTSPGEGPQFKDIALVRGVTGTRPHDGDTTLPSTAWDPAFADVNDDGLVDLFVTKGNVDEQPDYAIRDPSDLFLQQPDGTFTESAAAAGITGYPKARGAALVDLNLDGSLDLVVVNRLEPARIWRNVGDGTEAQPRAQGHWLELRLHQNGPNRDAIGGWIEVGTGVLVQSHELTVGGGHAGGDVGWIHFGLGGADHAQVRVTWPDGSQGPWTDVVADQFAIADRNSGTFERWTPPRP